MLLSLGLILLCQLVGEAIAHAIAVPVPGPVIGLVLCVGLLTLRDRRGRAIPAELRDGTFEKTGSGLLSHLSLLFVPAGVGVIQRLDVLTGNALPIVAAVVVSTVLSMVVTALVFTVVARRAR
ncbi:CidA/LrgA family protein [Rhodopila sp.]|uniref:CidA/LrgA family protein n=1 Tax=Rhodopila sp. TaxID=2480087 RepID=UPI003D102142